MIWVTRKYHSKSNMGAHGKHSSGNMGTINSVLILTQKILYGEINQPFS